MNYRVILTRRAQQDLQDIARWWSTERSAAQADQWLARFEQRLQSLAAYPTRCPPAGEQGHVTREIREFHFGVGSRPTHRAVFAIAEDLVLILAIRHAAQDSIDPGELASEP